MVKRLKFSSRGAAPHPARAFALDPQFSPHRTIVLQSLGARHLGATHIVHRASRHKVYDGTTTSVRHSQLGWLHAASPTFFWRSALHKDGSGRARSGSSEVVHSSSVSIRTHLPDAHVTRWPSGRARSRPPSAPLIGKGRAAERSGVPAIRQRVALPDRPRIFTGTCAIVSRMCPSQDPAFIRPPQREREGHPISCGLPKRSRFLN